MEKLNIPSFGALIPRERRIRAIQDLYQYVNSQSSVTTTSSISAENGADVPTSDAVIEYVDNAKEGIVGEVEINASTNSSRKVDSNVYTKVTGLDSLSKDTTIKFSLGTKIDNTQNLYEGSFDTASDITTSGKKLSVEWPASVNWGNSDISLSPSTHYEFSIRLDSSGYYGIIKSWSLE